MRILINALAVFRGGMRTYLLNLIPHLGRLGDHHDFVLLHSAWQEAFVFDLPPNFTRLVAADARDHLEDTGALPDAATLGEWFEVEVGPAEQSFAGDLAAINDFLTAGKPADWTDARYEGLQRRWGWADGVPAKVSAVVAECGVTADELLAAETELLARLGYRVVLGAADKRKWLRS